MKNKLKNTLLKKTYIWAIFPLCGPASAFVGCWGLCGSSWISCTSKKNTLKKKTHLWPKRRQTRRLGRFPSSWASFSLFVGLCWLLWAFMAVVHAKEGVWWVWCSRLSCTVKKDTATGICNMAGSTGRVTDLGMHGSGVLPGLPAPVPVTLGVWPDPCLSLLAQNDILHCDLYKLCELLEPPSFAFHNTSELDHMAYLLFGGGFNSCLDSGCTDHIITDCCLFQTYVWCCGDWYC